MSKVLVTGGAGFIGSNLVERLLQDDDEIIIVDDLSMGLAKNIPTSSRITFYQHSITDHEFMANLLIENKFDYIYLLAAIASVADSIERPYETHQVNQEANVFMLETIRQNKLPVKKILFSSSAAVYGNLPDLPKTESLPVDPLTPYAIDKFATERFVLDYGKLYELPTVAVRFFNVYGPRQNPKSPYSGVLSLISESIVHHATFNIFGDGEQTRDFVFVADVIQALILLTKETEVKHQVFNVATGYETSLNRVISTYEDITGQSLNVNNRPARQGDIKQSYANIDALRSVGFKPKFNLKNGLTEYWESLQA